MKPRRLLFGTTYLVTRRTFEGVFRLAPKPQINKILLFCLLHAAKRFKIQLHGFCFMSNHYHLVISDPHANLSRFAHWLDLYSAKCLNVLLGRRGPVWVPGSFSAQELHRKEDVLEKLLYVACNPTRARLVRKPSQWPGLISLPEHFAPDHQFTAQRPKVFFRRNGKEIPESVSRALVVPPGFRSREEIRRELESAIAGRRREIEDSLPEGERGFLGKHKLCLDPEHRPAVATLPRVINPFIACKDKVLRQALIAEYQVFWRAHESARRQVQAGKRKVRFPHGTNWWRHYGGMPCDKGPPKDDDPKTAAS